MSLTAEFKVDSIEDKVSLGGQRRVNCTIVNAAANKGLYNRYKTAEETDLRSSQVVEASVRQKQKVLKEGHELSTVKPKSRTL